MTDFDYSQRPSTTYANKYENIKWETVRIKKVGEGDEKQGQDDAEGRQGQRKETD